jgi:hypothetical protein
VLKKHFVSGIGEIFRHEVTASRKHFMSGLRLGFMNRRVPGLMLIGLLLAACAPRASAIESGVSATLTALAPTSALPSTRSTSTPVPTLPPPTPTPAPTDAPSPTATGSPEPTATPQLENATLGDLIFEDEFDSPGLWSLGETDESNLTVNGGVMTFTQKKAGSFSFRITGKQGDNFHAEVSAALADRCNSGDRYGLMFRVQDPSNYYLFQIDCEARYRFVRYVADASTVLVDWTESEAIERGEQSANTLGVTAKDGIFLLSVNDQPLTTAADTTFASGRFGLLVGSNATPNFAVVFDNLRANKLP